MNPHQHIIDHALATARQLSDRHGSPQVIHLSLYATDADLRQLRPEDGPNATAATQRAITEATAAALRAAGYPVRFITLRAVDYLKWLSHHNKPNTPGHRAEWISLQH